MQKEVTKMVILDAVSVEGITGQLALNDVQNTTEPRIINDLLGRVLKRVAAGGRHSMVATDTAVWTFGCGNNGRLVGSNDSLQLTQVGQWKH